MARPVTTFTLPRIFIVVAVVVAIAMVEHQSDVTAVTNPTREDLPRYAPRDTGEVFDYLVRKGPMTFKEMADNTPFMSRDDVFDALQVLEDTGYVDNVSGDIEEHGTTRDVWYVPVNN